MADFRNKAQGQKSLTSKRVVVTGAAQGIGRAISEACAEAGATHLFLVDKDEAGLSDTLLQLTARQVTCEGLVGDLARTDFVEQIIAHAVEFMGGVDGLVNAAGIASRTPLCRSTAEDWDHIMGVNAKAPYLLMRDFVSLCLSNRAGGTVVNISSMNAKRGTAELPVYSASKAALDLLTKNLAHTFAEQRVRFNAIDVGWVDTPGERQIQRTLGKTDDWLDAISSAQPFGRLLLPEDVARLAVFLLGEDSFPMTGAVIDQEQVVAGGR